MISVKLNTINNNFYLKDSARINKLCLKLSLECENITIPLAILYGHRNSMEFNATESLRMPCHRYKCFAINQNGLRSFYDYG